MLYSAGINFGSMAATLKLAFLLLLLRLVAANYPWPENVTQHSGYISVSCYARDYASTRDKPVTYTPDLTAEQQLPGRCALLLLVLREPSEPLH